MIKANNKIIAKYMSLSTLSLILFLSVSNAWAVTEKEILEADPRKMLKGMMQACKENNERKFFTYYSSNLIYMFSKESPAGRTKLFVMYCKEFQAMLKPHGPIDKVKVSVIKTQSTQDQRPVFAMCLSHPSINKICKGRGELDIYLENSQVKMDEH